MAQQPLSSAVQPTDIYGGDEVSALVLDPGYCSTRAGFAGEDVPKSVLPSFYGHVGGRDIFGDEVMIAREGFEVRNYMGRDSVVENWDVAPRLWEHMLVKRLQPDRAHLLGRTPAIAKPKPADAPTANGNGEKPADGEGDVAMDDAAAGAAAAAAAAEAEAESSEDMLETALGENPLLMTEAPWNPTKAREKAIEIAMEGWGVPAFWLTKTPALAAFAAGKATALIVDVGGANASVVAVHDGMVLKRSIQHSPIGSGLWVSGQIRSMWDAQDPPVKPAPHFLVENKTPVDAGAEANARLRTFPFDVSLSFRAYEDERLMTEFKESVVEVWRGPQKLAAPTVEDYVRSQPGRVFEMPDGSNQMWREQRYKVTEGMWDEAAAYGTQASAPAAVAAAAPAPTPAGGSEDSKPAPAAGTKPMTIPDLIRASLNGVDPDLRGAFLGAVVVTGSSTLFNGFNDRLNAELTAMYPSARVKLHAAGLTSERRFGAWIGGSILASLGTFHQMWISRKEYEENGPGIVEKRCK
ncbi:hypothetical protein RB601_003378 [Gaeumannomyces tritici]